MPTEYQQKIIAEQNRIRQEAAMRNRQLQFLNQGQPQQDYGQQGGGMPMPSYGMISKIISGIKGGGAAEAGAVKGGETAVATKAGATAGGGKVAGAGLTAYWPAAVVAAAVGQHMWAKNKGYHDNKDAIDGTALYDDVKNYYQGKANKVWDGLGDTMSLGALGGAPKEWLDKDKWKDALGDGIAAPFKMIKKLFK